mmetsp:Transcript_21376/g.45523  ORF Transcript_21376/g.45523 Transcript_21376/m.45523 type:complete len:941 (-) Transcript_21376:71-2893(-)
MAYFSNVDGLRPGILVEIDGDKAHQGQLGQLQRYVREEKQFEIKFISGETALIGEKFVRAPKDFKKPGEGGDEKSFDMLMGPQTSDALLAEEISQCIFEKGFCVLKVCQSLTDVEATVEAVRELGDAGALGRLPQEVEEGYLGAEGKGKVIWLDPDDPDLVQDDVLDQNNKNLSHLASLVQPYCEDIMGREIDERTPALLSLSLMEDDEDDYPFPMADDKILGDFLGTWKRGLLRAVHFMGPADAVVTLEGKGGAKAAALPNLQESISIVAPANTIVIFRTECYSYSCAAAENEEVLTMMASFLSAAPKLTLSHWEGDIKLLSELGAGPPPKDETPINVLNVNMRLGANLDEPEFMAGGFSNALDTIVEIPIVRFDVDFYFCHEPDEVQFGPPRTIQRHTSYVEGIDLFDNKYFEIANAEATAMDPLQRQVLEVGGACLYEHGITKKISNRKSHHAGCSVGLDKDDFTTLGIDNGPSAGNNALAIVANRFSFVFNLKGSNYICDTACSASLTATHLAKLMLLERQYDPLDFHIAIGTHLCLSVGPFIGCSMSHMVSPQGRCFTFNASANGYLRGEGTSGMCLKYGGDDQRDAVYRASQSGQDGRSASLTAPNGPAQEELISRAFKEAHESPPEATAWECHGTGTSLGDPIEVGAVRKLMIKHERPEPLMMTTGKTNIGHLEGGAAMSSMCKCVQMVMHSSCFAALHLKQLNAHLEHSVFDAFFENEMHAFAYKQGNAHISSFGFGGTNGHVVFWGQNVINVPSIKEQIMKRLSKMAPPEVRPIGDNPDEWDHDMPDLDAKPGDLFFVSVNETDPKDAPLKWEKQEGPDMDDDADDVFFSITGNFNAWEDDRMAPGDVPGQNVATVTVPSSGVLEFRFLKEGDSEMVIAPEMASCTKKICKIKGPTAGLSTSWCISADPDTEYQVELFNMNGKYSVLWFKI